MYYSMEKILNNFFQMLEEFFKRIDFNYLWGVSAKFFVSLLYGYSFYLVSQFLNKSTNIKKLSFNIIIIIFAIVPLSYSNIIYKFTSFHHWILNGSVMTNYYSPQMLDLKNKIDNEKKIVRVVVLTGGSSVKPNFFQSFRN